MTDSTMAAELKRPELPFLPAKSEVARLIRNYDWSTSSLGAIEAWPPSLRTVTGMALLSPVPMVLLWGAAGTMIYNDAYSVFAGARHPALLGSDVREGWPEIVAFNDNVMNVCLSGGTLAYQDQELTLHRHGQPEQVWMNLDYSPVLDESGEPAGVVAFVVETTARVLAERQIKAEQARLSRLFEQAPGLMVMLSGPEHVFEMANPAYINSMGDRAVLGKPIRDALPEIEGQGFIELLDKVYQSGEAFVGTGVKIRLQRTPNGPEEDRYFDFVYQPVVDSEGKVTGIFTEGYDVTERESAVEAGRVNESRLHFLDSLGKAVGSVQEAEAILETTTRMLGEHLDISVCAYADMDPDEIMFTIRGDWQKPGAASIVGRYSLEAFGRQATELLSAGLPLVLSDTAKQLPAHEASTFLNLRLAATICVPLVRNGRLSALMAVHDSSPREWTEGELQLVTDVTERSWAYVQRVRMDAEAREAEQFFRQKLEAQVAERTAKLAESQVYIRTIFETSHLHQGLLSPDGMVLYANNTALQGIRATAEDVIGRPFWEAPWFTGTPGMSATVRHALIEMGEETVEGLSLVLNLPTGVRSFDFSMRPVMNDTGQLVAIVTEAVENTARLHAEQALRQAQKMEALGNLTGGIAHDFNNLLMAISGNLELLRKRLPDNPALLRLLDNASKGADRGAALTARMLTFARKQEIQLARVQVPRLIEGMADLLQSSLTPGIRLETEFAPDLAEVQTDSNLLESAVLNLVLNARDALNGTGNLLVNVSMHDLQGSRVGPTAGRYVLISVTDDGEGMDAATLRRATEPFFTTKEVGKGTGLGLSMIHGLAQQSGGRLTLESQPGKGTTATIWLPALQGLPDHLESEAATSFLPSHRPLRILAVDDDELVLLNTTDLLSDQGHSVVSAASGSQALELLRLRVFDVLVTDYAMPQMTGIELASAAREHHPDLAVVLVTGYAELAPDSRDKLWCLAKPFSQSALMETVMKAFDSRRAGN